MKAKECGRAPSQQDAEIIHNAVTVAPGLRLFFVLGALSMVLASLTGCRVRVGGEERPLLRHGRIRGEVELVAERRSDKQGTGANRRKSKTTVFEERLRLRTEGDIYHANLLFYSAALGFGLAQQNLSSDEESGSTSGTLNDYNVLAQVLRAKPYPATFHLSRSEDLIARQFLGSLKSERENAGVTLALRSKSWPMTFQYNTTEIRQDSLAATARDFFKRKDERFRYSVTHDFSTRSHMSFELERNTISQRSLGASTDIKEDRYTLIHDLIFGNKEQHRLDSFLSFLEQSGSFDFENLRWDERLRLRHSANFVTNYNFRFTDSERETLKNKQIRGLAGFEHKLYDSLVTTGNIFASKSDLDAQGDATQRGGTLGFSYRKKNRWGMLLGTYAVSLNKSEQSGGSGRQFISDESHTFTDPLPITLDRVNIDTSSITVTDSTGTQVYTRGDDYTVSETDGRVRLNVTTLGTMPPNITDGQELLVDYFFFVEPKRKEDTVRHNLVLRERFRNGLSVYYAHQRQDEKVSSSVAEVTPDEFRTNTFGADYVKGGLSLLAEYSKEDSTQISSTSKLVEARYSRAMNKNTTASVYASNHWLDFGEPDPRDITLFRSGGEIFSRLTDKYSISANLDYRDEDDTTFGTTEGIQFRSELRYAHRQLRVTTGGEFSLLKRSDDRIDSAFWYVRLTRFF